jgi:hypothetical protein
MEWSREIVSLRIREAWDTLRRVPAHGIPGFRTSWPDYIQDYFEAYGHSTTRIRLAPAAPQAIDRMNECFGWFRHLEGRPHLTKAVWLCCGCGMGPHRAGAILGAHRDTVRARRDEALDTIVEALRRAFAA